MKCPRCGAPEVEAPGPRTVYACGSSDYDGRPGSHRFKCKELSLVEQYVQASVAYFALANDIDKLHDVVEQLWKKMTADERRRADARLDKMRGTALPLIKCGCCGEPTKNYRIMRDGQNELAACMDCVQYAHDAVAPR